VTVSKKRPRHIMTPADLGDSRTRNAYKKPGPCIVYKMRGGSAVIDRTLEGLVAMSFDQAKEAGLDLCKEMSDSQLKKFWSVPLSYVRRMRYLLGIEKDRQGTIYIREGHPEMWPPVFRKMETSPDYRDRSPLPPPVAGMTGLEAAVQNAVQAAARDAGNGAGLPGMPAKQEKDASIGFTLSFTGIFHANELRSRIEAVKTLLSGSPDSKYAVDVTLKEIDNGSGTGRKNAEKLPDSDAVSQPSQYKGYS
jgi:hypothetical protein